MQTVPMPWQERIESFADQVLRASPGSIFSVQGNIGRGKTRLLLTWKAQLVNRGSLPGLPFAASKKRGHCGAALAAAAHTPPGIHLLNGQYVKPRGSARPGG